MLRQALLYLSENQALQRFVLSTAAARSAAARFVAGDTLPEAVTAVRALNDGAITASLNYLGEKTAIRDNAVTAARFYMTMLQTIRTEGVKANISVKLTQLGIHLDPDQCETLMREILTTAQRAANFVRIDMESSAYVDPTLTLYRRLRDDGIENVGIVLQSYLRRTAEDLESLLLLHPKVRLVKGAYAEAAAVAYTKKGDVDANYRHLAERLLTAAPMPAIATHDERLIEHTQAFARAHGIATSSFEYQMIYGVRRDLQERLAREGYLIRVYVPFGTQWFPYFMRRLAERPANVGFVLRSLLLEHRPRR